MIRYLIFVSLIGFAPVHAAVTHSFCDAVMLGSAEITSADVKRAEVYIVRAVTGLSIWGDDDWEKLAGERMNEVLEPYSTAVSLHVLGRDAAADELVGTFAKVIRRVTGRRGNLVTLRREVAEIAARPDIERIVAGALPALNKMIDVPAVFAGLVEAYPDGMVTGPQQIEMYRLLQQFGVPGAGRRTLAVGQGTAAILLTTRTYFPGGDLFGMDTHVSPSTDAARFAIKRNVRLDSSPLDRAAFDQLANNGPYHSIAVLESLASASAAVRKFELEPTDVLQAFGKMLAPGGVLVLLNDFGDEPMFTRRQAEDAGLTVVRWNVDRTLDPQLAGLIPYPADAARAGELRGFVLRKGPEETSGLSTYGRVVEN